MRIIPVVILKYDTGPEVPDVGDQDTEFVY